MRAALLVSLLVHALFLSLSVGGEALGLPGLHFPWEERRAAAHELHVVLAPEPAPAPVSTSAGSPAPAVALPAHDEVAVAPAPLPPPPIAPAAPPAATAPPAMSVAAPRKEEPSEKAVEEDVQARTEQLALARQEAARAESERQELARREEQAREAARIEQARLAEQARRDAARQEQERAEAARQEQARLAEQAKQDAERRERERVETARLDAERAQAARQEQVRQEQARQEQAKQEQAKQEQAKQDQARREAAERELAQQDKARKERAEQEAKREERLRAIGQQLAQEAAQRDAAKLAPGAGSLRRGWLFGRADPNADLIQYAQAMGRKIELNQSFDTVREVVRQRHVDPVVTVAIRADGSVEKLTFVTSSGVAAIDEAVRNVIASQAPYGAFPPALARQYDVIEIRRTWKFDVAIRLE